MIMMRERGAGWSGAGGGRVSGSGVRVLRAETRLLGIGTSIGAAHE